MEITLTSAGADEKDANSFVPITVEKDESILKALLRAGHDIPNGCRAGICQSCMMQSHQGAIPPQAQAGLKNTQKELGYFLACRCVPIEPMKISMSGISAQDSFSKVIDIQMISENVLRLRVEKVFDYRAGQFVTIFNHFNVGRCYSIASHPEEDDYIEFHIKVIRAGEFSAWAKNFLSVGDELALLTPMGECFYSVDDIRQPILLAGIGTGLAPLIGVIKDALYNNHKGDIFLYVGAKQASQFYFQAELERLAEKHKNLHIYWLAQEVDKQSLAVNVLEADIYQTVKTHHTNFKEMKIYLCGAESFVHKMKKNSYLAGADLKNISADVFASFNKT